MAARACFASVRAAHIFTMIRELDFLSLVIARLLRERRIFKIGDYHRLDRKSAN